MSVSRRAAAVRRWIDDTGSHDEREKLKRYGIPVDRAVGIPMREMKAKAKALGRDMELAEALWALDEYEARTIAVYVADPSQMPLKLADAWCAEFDSRAICDTAAFHLFDRCPFAWDRVRVWASDPRQYVCRAGLATLWGLTLHDKAASDESFTACFDMISTAASDARPHVYKAADMALRAIGKRNRALNQAVLSQCRQFDQSSDRRVMSLGAKARRELSQDKLQTKLTATAARTL